MFSYLFCNFIVDNKLNKSKMIKISQSIKILTMIASEYKEEDGEYSKCVVESIKLAIDALHYADKYKSSKKDSYSSGAVESWCKTISKL